MTINFENKTMLAEMHMDTMCMMMCAQKYGSPYFSAYFMA